MSGAPTQVPGLPPSDNFNNANNNFTNVEGVVWLDGSIYVSEIDGANKPPSRVLRLDAAGAVSVAIPNSGTNGLAVNLQGELFGALHGHKDGDVGSVSKLSLKSGTAEVIVNSYDSKPFNSPNDLTIRSDGTIYFSDPDWQAPSPPPQMGSTGLFRIAPGTKIAVLIEKLVEPNGVTLSPDERTLYVSGGQLRKYSLNQDGTVVDGSGADFVTGGGGDGMVVDCAGNLYVAQDQAVMVYSPTGALLGSITVSQVSGSVTNVAFGGPDHNVLYISGQGQGVTGHGVYRFPMNLPGFPY